MGLSGGERGEKGVLSSVLPGVRLRDEIKPAGNKIQHQPPGMGGIIGVEYFPSPDAFLESMWFVGENEKSSRGNLYLYYQNFPPHNRQYNTLTILLQGGSHIDQ